MPDYRPLDLSSICNAGAEILGSREKPPLGLQNFHGLPFLVGREGAQPEDRSFLLLNEATGGVTIPVGDVANNVIFAHRVLETEIPEGGPIGKEVAEYVVRYVNGGETRVLIRERFEIGLMPADEDGARINIALRSVPFLALGNKKDTLPQRYEGPWEETGRRQTELSTLGASEHTYFLWAWENPHPEDEIQSIEIVPKGPSFMIAAVTLGQIDERPFVTQGRREVRITLTDAELANRPFNVDVEVDRGVSTFVHSLPHASPDEFVADSMKGYGEPPNLRSSPAYVEIAATPSATVKVSQGGETVGEVRWGDLESQGSASTPALRVDLLDRGRNWVKVTVLDDDTGAPVPCRVHFRSPEGVPYQPHGHHNQVNSNLGTWHIDVGGDVRLGQITYAYIDGRCEGWLPRGEVIVDVARGFEYEPLREKVTIKPGQQDLKLRLKRWTNMNAKRWFSGDSHVHFLSTQGSHFESQGEDLNVVNLLQSQWGGLYTNTEDFTGRPSVSRDGSNIVYTSQENRQHFLGHMILWGLKEQVMPWCSDGPNEGELGGIMQTTMSHWADAAHAQGGRVVIPHFPHPNGEPATLIATGRVDAVEMIRHERFNHVEYYRYLNCGYRLPLVGGTDKMSNEVPVGLYRTYAYVPEDQEFNYENWCAAVSAGRTFLSGGPLLELSVDGHQIGDTVRMSGAGTVEVHASAESILPIHSLQIVMNGRVVASTENPSGERRLELRESVRIDANSWLAVRCGGPNYIDSTPHYDVWNRGVFAHTSPIYLAVGGDWEMYDQNAAQYMLTLIEGGMSYIRQTSHQHAPDSVSHHHGEEDHMAYLLRPFREAHEAVLARMHLQR